jgi:hypothetical protein
MTAKTQRYACVINPDGEFLQDRGQHVTYPVMHLPAYAIEDLCICTCWYNTLRLPCLSYPMQSDTYSYTPAHLRACHFLSSTRRQLLNTHFNIRHSPKLQLNILLLTAHTLALFHSSQNEKKGKLTLPAPPSSPHPICQSNVPPAHQTAKSVYDTSTDCGDD